MRPNHLLGFSAILVTQTAALKLPFNIPFFSNNDQAPLIDITALLPSSTPPNRIAIIGAGAAGSSAAFWIAKAKERFGLDVEVDVYEKNDYIGGRTLIPRICLIVRVLTTRPWIRKHGRIPLQRYGV